MCGARRAFYVKRKKFTAIIYRDPTFFTAFTDHVGGLLRFLIGAELPHPDRAFTQTMNSTPSHRPRRKRKGDGLVPAGGGHGLVISQDGCQKPAFPLVAFLWPAKGISHWIVVPCVLMIAGLFRWGLGFWGYTGIPYHYIARRCSMGKTDKAKQATKNHQCTAISKLNDIGWRLPRIFQSLSGTSMNSNGGVWIIHQSLHIIAGYWERCMDLDSIKPSQRGLANCLQWIQNQPDVVRPRCLPRTRRPWPKSIHACYGPPL